MENTKHAVGLDIGTSAVRVVVATLREAGQPPAVIGCFEVPSSGMRRGVMSSLTGPTNAVAQAIHETEKMIGYDIKHAMVGINGAHIATTRTEGMIILPGSNVITDDDLTRLEENAVTGKMPPNRTVLSFVPHNYTLDGQSGIRDPLGMSGQRLEVKASIVSSFTQAGQGLTQMLSELQISADGVIPTVVAAGNAVLSDRQKDNGVAVLDLGASTTSIAVFHGGDIRFVSVIPVGSNDLTNDLAVMLQTNTELAEEVKKLHVGATHSGEGGYITLHKGRETFDFDRDVAEETVVAKLDEIFASVQEELKKAGFDHRLPDGVVLTGGGSRLKGMVEYASRSLEVAVRLGSPAGFSSALKEVSRPEMAAAIGLMLYDLNSEEPLPERVKGPNPLQKLFSSLKRRK